MLLRLYKQRLVSYYHISQKKKRKEEQVSCEASQPSKEFSDNEKESKAKKGNGTAQDTKFQESQEKNEKAK